MMGLLAKIRAVARGLAVGNCMLYALTIWKWRSPESCLVIRRSHYGWWPHFGVLWHDANGVTLEEFVPDDPHVKKVPPPVFRGHVQITRYRREL